MRIRESCLMLSYMLISDSYNVYFNPPKVEGKDDITGEGNNLQFPICYLPSCLNHAHILLLSPLQAR